MEETAGVKMRELPRPQRRERVRMKCHNSVRIVISWIGVTEWRVHVEANPRDWASRTYSCSQRVP